VTEVVEFGDLLAAATELASRGRREILGITGAPGAGQSTLARRLVEAIGARRVVLIPMDGFHLANAILVESGLRQVKGAIETFDDAGYAHLMQRIRCQRPGETIYAPTFDRNLEEPIAGSIAVTSDVPLVITEGNYLLAETRCWPLARECLTESWFLDPPRADRIRWLTARHEHNGRSPEQARRWAIGSDERNAQLIQATAPRADRLIRFS
jgi:pantothenate kinase